MSAAQAVRAAAHASHPLARQAALVERAWGIPAMRALVRELSQSPTFCRSVCPLSDSLTMNEKDCLAILLARLGRLWDAFKIGKSSLTVEQFIEVTGLPKIVTIALTDVRVAKFQEDDTIDFLPLLELPWVTTHEEKNAYWLAHHKERKQKLALVGIKKERKKNAGYVRKVPRPEHMFKAKPKPAVGPQPGG